MLMYLGALCLTVASASALPSAQNRSSTIQACTNHPEGFCIDSTQYECPAGWMWSYSGCGFLEKCCYPQSGTGSAIHVTNAPVATSAPTHAAQTTSGPTCVDLHPSCASWASQGECTHNPAYMLHNCKASCGHCPGASPVTHAPSHSAGCGVSTVDPGLKIVGGEQTSIEAHPWQISLRMHNQHICGGSLVGPNWVMTAAHCVADLTSTSGITILVGSTNSRSYSHSNVHSVSRILVHADYKHSDGNDIAMIKLTSSVDLTARTTRAVCLPEPGETFAGQTCIASGWGYMQEDASTVSHLRHVALPIISNSLCGYYMSGVSANVICAGRTSGGIDTCQGDSGGPLVCKSSDGTYKQAGIVSTGVGCARRNRFGFYTAVESFQPWVKSVMSRY